jgi:hypothetical protein
MVAVTYLPLPKISGQFGLRKKEEKKCLPLKDFLGYFIPLCTRTKVLKL